MVIMKNIMVVSLATKAKLLDKPEIPKGNKSNNLRVIYIPK